MMIEFEGSDNRGLLAAIFSSDRKNFDAAFPPDAAAYFSGKSVRIRGKVEKYGGKSDRYLHYPQIILHTTDQISVVAATLAPAATPASSVPPGLRIDAKDQKLLAAHLDSGVTVFGTVRTAAWTTNGSVLNMDFEKDDEHALLVVLFPKNRAAFESVLGADIGKALTGKAIELKGKLVAYGGKVQAWKDRPQIVLSSPGQLRLLPVNVSPGTQ